MKKVLVVDDDLMIRELAEKILTRSEFRVHLTENGQEATDFLTSQKEQIAVALIDFMLEDTNGIELVKNLREISPDLPCILSSGNILNINDLPSKLRIHTYFLSKPYRPAKLVEMVTMAIDSTAK